MRVALSMAVRVSVLSGTSFSGTPVNLRGVNSTSLVRPDAESVDSLFAKRYETAMPLIELTFGLRVMTLDIRPGSKLLILTKFWRGFSLTGVSSIALTLSVSSPL